MRSTRIPFSNLRWRRIPFTPYLGEITHSPLTRLCSSPNLNQRHHCLSDHVRPCSPCLNWSPHQPVHRLLFVNSLGAPVHRIIFNKNIPAQKKTPSGSYIAIELTFLTSYIATRYTPFPPHQYLNCLDSASSNANNASEQMYWPFAGRLELADTIVPKGDHSKRRLDVTATHSIYELSSPLGDTMQNLPNNTFILHPPPVPSCLLHCRPIQRHLSIVHPLQTHKLSQAAHSSSEYYSYYYFPFL